MTQQEMIDDLTKKMYGLGSAQKDPKVKHELFSFAGSIPNYGKQVNSNIELLNKCLLLDITFVSNIKGMVAKGLMYENGDYYIFIQKGDKLTISMSPAGVAKAVNLLLEKREIKSTLSIGLIREGDEVELETEGTVQRIKVKRGKDSLFKRKGAIIGCYGVASIFSKKTDQLMSQNVIIIDQVEYQAILQTAKSAMKTYESSFANKIILRRYANLLPAFIGGSLTDEDLETLSEASETSRVDKETPPAEVEKVDPNKPPRIEKPTEYRDQDVVVELSEKFENTKAFVKACGNLGYYQDKDTRLLTLLLRLDDEEYETFVKDLMKNLEEEK